VKKREVPGPSLYPPLLLCAVQSSEKTESHPPMCSGSNLTVASNFQQVAEVKVQGYTAA